MISPCFGSAKAAVANHGSSSAASAAGRRLDRLYTATCDTLPSTSPDARSAPSVLIAPAAVGVAGAASFSWVRIAVCFDAASTWNRLLTSHHPEENRAAQYAQTHNSKTHPPAV